MRFYKTIVILFILMFLESCEDKVFYSKTSNMLDSLQIFHPIETADKIALSKNQWWLHKAISIMDLTLLIIVERQHHCLKKEYYRFLIIYRSKANPELFKYDHKSAGCARALKRIYMRTGALDYFIYRRRKQGIRCKERSFFRFTDFKKKSESYPGEVPFFFYDTSSRKTYCDLAVSCADKSMAMDKAERNLRLIYIIFSKEIRGPIRKYFNATVYKIDGCYGNIGFLYLNNLKNRICLPKEDAESLLHLFDESLRTNSCESENDGYKVVIFEHLPEMDALQTRLRYPSQAETHILNKSLLTKRYGFLKLKRINIKKRFTTVKQFDGSLLKIFTVNPSSVFSKYYEEFEKQKEKDKNAIGVIKQETQNTILLYSTIVLGLICVLLIICMNIRKRKATYELIKTRYEISKTERNRISQELHDDLGAHITSIIMATELLKNKLPEQTYKKPDIILRNIHMIHTKIKEIIWSLNSDNDTLGNLIIYIKNFSKSFLEQTDLEFHLKDETEEHHDLFVDSFIRRRIYLTVKEIINNTVKHSGATRIDFHLKMLNKNYLCISISDNGQGFDKKKDIKGNGLMNIVKNIDGIKDSQITMIQSGKGVKYEMTINLKLL